MPPRKKPEADAQVADANLLNDPSLPDPEDAHLFEDSEPPAAVEPEAEKPRASRAAKPATPEAPPAAPVKIWGRLAPHNPDNGQPSRAIHARRRLFNAGVWVEVSADDRAALVNQIGHKPKGGAAVRLFEFAEGAKPSR